MRVAGLVVIRIAIKMSEFARWQYARLASRDRIIACGHTLHFWNRRPQFITPIRFLGLGRRLKAVYSGAKAIFVRKFLSTGNIGATVRMQKKKISHRQLYIHRSVAWELIPF